MRFEMAIRSNESVRSAIVNCVCPECGGALGLQRNQFRCLGMCGKDWRPIWECSISDERQAQPSNNSPSSQKLNRAAERN